MGFPSNVAEKALLDCGRHCCICHKFCGFKIELHHIIQEANGGQNTYENCIPLCFDCHAEVKAYDPNHPKGRKYTETELQGHRNRWYEKVKNSHGITTNPEYVKIDQKLFLEIQQILPSKGTVWLIRKHDYRGTFRLSEHTQDLYKFWEQCQTPEFEFIDVDIETLRLNLLDKINTFLGMLGKHTFSLEKKPELQRIPLHLIDSDIVIEINKSADELTKAYDELIRLGRRKLGV